MVGDREFYNIAAELTRIMGHKSPGRFFNDPTAVDPRTGQLLHPPPAAPPPDPRLLALQARGLAEQQKIQADAIHQQVKVQAEIELAKIKAELDAKIKVLETHLKAATEQQKMEHTQARHDMEVAQAALRMAAAADAIISTPSSPTARWLRPN